jgi:phosphate transport system substrate-binding protein
VETTGSRRIRNRRRRGSLPKNEKNVEKMSRMNGLARRVSVALMAAVVCQPSLAFAGEVLKIGGTGGAVGTVKRLAAAYGRSHPDVKFEVLPSLGSGGAVKAISRGALDIGLISRPLRESERFPGLEVREFAVTPFVFATSTACPMTDITTGELVEVYGGETQRWPCGRRVRLVLRPAGDSDTAVLRGISPALSEAVDSALARPGMFVAMTDQEAADALDGSPERFGATTLALIVSEDRQVRILALNGVTPSLQGLADGSYPLSKTFSFVTSGRPSRQGAAFIDFVFSPEGRKIVKESGSLPVSSGN